MRSKQVDEDCLTTRSAQLLVFLLQLPRTDTSYNEIGPGSMPKILPTAHADTSTKGRYIDIEALIRLLIRLHSAPDVHHNVTVHTRGNSTTFATGYMDRHHCRRRLESAAS